MRHRGTIGGSIANNDPNADYPAACLGLGATIVTNKRRVKADDFFSGMFLDRAGAVGDHHQGDLPAAEEGGPSEIPQSGVALRAGWRVCEKRGSDIRVAVTGAGSNGVFRVKSFEEALKKRFSPKPPEGATIPADGMNSDIHGSAEYRAHLVAALARRAVAEAIGKRRRKGAHRVSTPVSSFSVPQQETVSLKRPPRLARSQSCDRSRRRLRFRMEIL